MGGRSDENTTTKFDIAPTSEKTDKSISLATCVRDDPKEFMQYPPFQTEFADRLPRGAALSSLMPDLSDTGRSILSKPNVVFSWNRNSPTTLLSAFVSTKPGSRRSLHIKVYDVKIESSQIIDFSMDRYKSYQALQAEDWRKQISVFPPGPGGRGVTEKDRDDLVTALQYNSERFFSVIATDLLGLTLEAPKPTEKQKK